MTDDVQVGYTLTLHNQLETAKVDKELRDMTQKLGNVTEEMRNLTQDMKNLTQDTVDDSATVKIITFVSAIYLPGSFVGVSPFFVPRELQADNVQDHLRHELLQLRPSIEEHPNRT